MLDASAQIPRFDTDHDKFALKFFFFSFEKFNQH